jgi:hypothetical protein
MLAVRGDLRSRISLSQKQMHRYYLDGEKEGNERVEDEEE